MVDRLDDVFKNTFRIQLDEVIDPISLAVALSCGAIYIQQTYKCNERFQNSFIVCVFVPYKFIITTLSPIL